MTDEKAKKKKENGGNGSEKGQGGIPIGIPLDPVKEQKRLFEEKHGHYVFLKLVKLLNIVPCEVEGGKPKPEEIRWMSLTFGNYLYDFTEILEKAIERIEELEKE